MKLSWRLVNCVILSFATGGSTCLAEAPDAVPVEIQSAMNRSGDDPEALLELKGAPLKWTFDYLLHQTSTIGYVQTPGLLRRAEIANEILFSHPDLERYLRSSLDDAYNFYERKPITSGRKMDDAEAINITTYYTIFAERIPGPAAFRIVGPVLFSEYFKKVDERDSPADWGRMALAHLAKERLGETIPEDIEGARRWWTENEHWFAAEASPPTPELLLPPSPPKAPVAASTALPLPSVPASEAKKGSQYSIGMFVGAMVAVLGGCGCWLFRRRLGANWRSF